MSFEWHDDPELIESMYGGPTPAEERLDRLKRLFDVAWIDDDYGLDDRSILDDLGEGRKHVLIAIAELSEPEWSSGGPVPDWATNEDYNWAERSDVTERAYHNGYHPASENALRAGVSDAIHGLCDRGLVAGLYRAWRYFTDGQDAHLHTHGPDPWSFRYDRQPTLQYVRLPRKGWNAVYTLNHAVINGDVSMSES